MIKSEKSQQNTALIGAIVFALMAGFLIGKFWNTGQWALSGPFIGGLVAMIIVGWRKG